MGIRQHETILNLRADLEAANDEIHSLRKEQRREKDLQARVDRLHGFVMDLFYLHPPLKEAYFGWHGDSTLFGHLRPKYEYVANLAEAKRNVETLNSADLARIDRYLEAVLGEEEA